MNLTEDDVEQPSSPSVKKTEETGVLVVHEVKCKLYVKVIFKKDRYLYYIRPSVQQLQKGKRVYGNNFPLYLFVSVN